MRCDCGSYRVHAKVADVRVRGKRIVFVCESCGLSWTNTEPNVIEQLITARAPVGTRWDGDHSA